MEKLNDSNRRNYSADFKFKVIKESLTTDSSITEICKKHGIGTNMFYKWQESFLQGAKEGFDKKATRLTKSEQHKVNQLEEENSKLKSAISVLVSENIELKKKNWL